jgi:hypothetical protein
VLLLPVWRCCSLPCAQIVIGGRDKYTINGLAAQQG